MAGFNTSVSKIADTLVSMASLFNCSLEEAWEMYMHPFLTESSTLEEVKKFIDDKVSLVEKYKE